MSHPLTRLLFDEMRARHVSVAVMAKRSGINPQTIRYWLARPETSPTLVNIEACLNVLGFNLKAFPFVRSVPRVAFQERGAGQAG